VDARSDIFSFGALLYEMLTARRAFQRESRMSTIAAILREEPRPIAELTAEIPHEMERIIASCLRKDRERRFQHMDDVKIALEELKEDSSSGRLAAPPIPRRFDRRLIWVAAALGILTAAVVLFRPPRRAPQAASLQAVPLTTYPGYECCPSLSPDGSQVAFSWNGEKQDNYDIYVQVIGSGAPLRLTSHPATDAGPAWSPDGRQIAFLRYLSGKTSVVLVPPLGGPERVLEESPGDLNPPYLA
jgi:hypothetical protein